jgi:hypothetical protein
MQRPKLTLDLDALVVESFDTDPRGGGGGGTVFGHNNTVQEPVDVIETAAQTCQCGTGGCTAQTACGQAGCGGGGASGFATCGLTYCNDTCDLCYSLITDSPQRC